MLTKIALLSVMASICCAPTLAASIPQSTAAATAAAPCNPQQFAKMKKTLQDWPDLARYRKADAELPPAAAGVSRVVFMGDSITDIWGRMKGTGEFFPGKPYVNRGISGQTTPQMLIRFQQDVVDLHPAVVLILAGTNDIAGNTGPTTNNMIENNYRSMAEIAEANHIKVIFASITPAAAYPWRPGIDPVERIHEVNEWLRQYCKQNGFVYLDYYDALALPNGAMKPGISFDGVHPNAKGFAIMAPLAEKAIRKALKNESAGQ
jgi:lysophospholipase L1-like esterase